MSSQTFWSLQIHLLFVWFGCDSSLSYSIGLVLVSNLKRLGLVSTLSSFESILVSDGFVLTPSVAWISRGHDIDVRPFHVDITKLSALTAPKDPSRR